MTTIGFGVAGRAGVVGRAGVGDVEGCAAVCGCGAATGLRFVVGLRLVWLTEMDERASKRIRGKGLSFIPELIVFLLNDDFARTDRVTGRTVTNVLRYGAYGWLIRAQRHDWRCLLKQRQGANCSWCKRTLANGLDCERLVGRTVADELECGAVIGCG